MVGKRLCCLPSADVDKQLSLEEDIDSAIDTILNSDANLDFVLDQQVEKKDEHEAECTMMCSHYLHTLFISHCWATTYYLIFPFHHI